MSKLMLLALLFSRDTIITNLAPASLIRPAATPSGAAIRPTTNPVTLQVLNTSSTPLTNLILDWFLQTDGVTIKKGKTAIALLPGKKPVSLRPGLHMPMDTAGETFLLIRIRAVTTGSVLSEQQILLRPWLPHLTILPAGELTASGENDTFTIRSPDIRISFNRQTGWLEHYEIKGIDLVDDTSGLRPDFWWPGPRLQLFSTTTSPQQITVRTEYTLPATACLLHLGYIINAAGEMLVSQHLEPDTTQPATHDSIPRFGMEWNFPSGYDSVAVYGPLADSSRVGIMHEQASNLRPPDPKSVVTATHTNVRWCSVTDKNGNGLQFIADTTMLKESVHQTQIRIDDATIGLLPIGNYRFAYKVKPLVNLTPH